MKSRLLRSLLVALTALALPIRAQGQQCSGMAEIMGNDMIVSLGPSDGELSFFTHGPTLYAVWNESGTVPVVHTGGRYKYAMAVGGTLLHELGHNLRLCHEGPTTDAASGNEVLFVTSDNGRLYKLDAKSGTVLASADTRRAICSDDQITATPSVQLYSKSNPQFQSAMQAERGHSDDLVFVTTHHGCGDGTGNQVIAYYGSDLTPKWIFNSDGSSSMDYAADGCEVDYTRNQVYLGTHEALAGQPTVWGLDVLAVSATARLKWSHNAGSLSNRPMINTGELYLVAGTTIQRLDPTNGSVMWTLPTGSAVVRNVWPEYRAPLPSRIFYTTADGSLHGTLENFPSPVPLWPPVSPPTGIKFSTMPALAKGTGTLYVGRDDGSIQQVSADTGTPQSSVPVARPGTLWDPVPESSTPTAQSDDRLNITTTEGSIRRYCIPPGGTTGVASAWSPSSLALAQSAPNPFSTDTRIDYRLPQAARVEIDVFAIDGRRVRRLVGEQQPAGMHDVAWDARDDAGQRVASGPYFYRLRVVDAAGRTQESSKKVQLVR